MSLERCVHRVSQNKTRSAFDIFGDVNDDEEWRFITNGTFNIKCFSLFWTLFWIKIYVHKFKDLIYISSFLEALNFNVTACDNSVMHWFYHNMPYYNSCLSTLELT